MQFTIAHCDYPSSGEMFLYFSLFLVITLGPLLVWWLRRGARRSGYGLSSTSSR